ncbi:MAG: O-antigen ligase family protein [Bacteroidota bacterium]
MNTSGTIANKALLVLTVLGGVTLMLAAIFLELLPIAGVVALFPFLLIGVGLVFQKPKLAFPAMLVLAFTASGLKKYAPSVPMGLTLDGILALTLLAIWFHKREGWQKDVPGRALMLATWVWMLYTLMQIVNPEAHSFTAWFYAVRGVSLYPILTFAVALALLKEPKDMMQLVHTAFALSVLGTLWGMKQLYIGLDGAEWAWLRAGNESTHILHGQLRVFSFYSDAGQFGASQAHVAVIAGILAIGPFSWKRRMLYAAVAAVTLYGMLISGTRGALAVPAAGGMAFLLLTRNTKLFMAGMVMGIAVFCGLKYTYIGQGVPQISRMRTALDPEDPSFQTRLENQRSLASYLASRPIGGGVGTAGFWGLRFSPNTFLAQTPTDSWYVKIWAETGWVGLTLYFGWIGFMLGWGGFVLWQTPRGPTRQFLLALYCGMVGILLASYGNGVLGAPPTGPLIYLTFSFLFINARWQKNPQI